ncbi:MAG: hypothetical protein K0R63_829 [Rickettsiales bacterium]|jgi:hypothetical protein|nr:hypothetical protein [Rickettsiales bacterium]
MILLAPSSHQYVFIAGLHRSGTSLLHEMLREHPEISGFAGTGVPEDEGQHLQSIYRPAKDFGGPGRFAFNPNSYLDEESSLVTPENQQKLFKEWSRYWDLSRSILLEKSPPNIVRLRFLAAMFPQMKTIVVVRHPLAVSLATQKWSGTNLDNLLSHWEIAHQQLEQDLQGISSYIIVRYEDLVRSPDRVLARIYKYIGVAPHTPSQEIDSLSNTRYFRRWQVLWREQTLESLRILVRRSRAYRAWGYSLMPPYVLKYVDVLSRHS